MAETNREIHESQCFVLSIQCHNETSVHLAVCKLTNTDKTDEAKNKICLISLS
jgi:hypothetical protein